jgi:hypothetical protein
MICFLGFKIEFPGGIAMFQMLRRSLALLLLPTLLAACSSTTLSGSWKSPEFQGKVRKVYIVAVANKDIVRRMIEDEFGRQLPTMGATALSSYQELTSLENVDRQAVAERIRVNGADSVLMARLVDRYTEQVTSQPVYYSNWGGYYDNRFESIYIPPSTVEFDIAAIEAKLFDAKTGNLIWSGHLETLIEPAAMEKTVSDFVKTVAEDLQKKGLL